MSLSWWEQFIIGSVISFLVMLESKVTNQTELVALKATVQFLQDLLNGSQLKSVKPQ